ncbi:hypothetical protein A2U01_0051330 [Trifolium medium]|uniref:Uncharacterized protein n=1 Tax=Trifolium medium TaxID=97028 RepID=A0A392R0J8_9FABA|nr:hypothetical protein [Trifolium medium]
MPSFLPDSSSFIDWGLAVVMMLEPLWGGPFNLRRRFNTSSDSFCSGYLIAAYQVTGAASLTTDLGVPVQHCLDL